MLFRAMNIAFLVTKTQLGASAASLPGKHAMHCTLAACQYTDFLQNWFELNTMKFKLITAENIQNVL